MKRTSSRLGVAACLAGAAAFCLLSRREAPPPARGVVLVFAAGFGGEGAAARTPALARLARAGRSFEAAFAPDPEPRRARQALLGEGDAALAALLRSRGVALAGLGDAALPLEAGTLDLSLSGSAADADVALRLETWLRARQQPFVVMAALGGEPGAPAGEPPPTTVGAFAPALPRIAVGDLGFSDRPGGELRPAAWSLPARQRAEAAHLARTLAADRELELLLAFVERAARGVAVVVVGDPPPDRGAHGILDRAGLFDETLRSALVIATPGLAGPGRASSRLVSTLDVVPTLLDLLGLPPERALGALSLTPLLADPKGAGRAEALSSVPRKAARLGRSTRTPRFRYNEWPDGSRELYDHDSDPRETTNLTGRPEHAATLRELDQDLRDRMEAKKAKGAMQPSHADPRLPPRLAPAHVAPPRRNVVLIVIDDLNTRIGAWGAPVKTPSIDRLAARGVRFDRAYAAVAMCSPSRVSMLTGWRPERTGVWQNEDPPRPEAAVPLQELFAAHGALTASIGKIYHSPADFRWDVREESPEGVEDRDANVAGEDMAGLWARAAGGDLDQPDGRRARRAAALLEGPRTPFFLALGLVRPHLRWVVPARYFGLYPPDQITLLPFPERDLADVPAIAIKTQPQPLPGLPLFGREPPGLVPDPGYRRQAIAAYQAAVSFADAQVGVVLDALDRGDRWKDTVVVLAGDNGFHLGEHGGLLRKDTLFEEALRVPLVVAAPDLPRTGAVVKSPVELLDVYPTIVELAGLPPPSGLDGQSLVPLLRNPEAEGRGFARSWRRVQPPERGFSLRTERLRYTLWPDGSEELYDLRGQATESESLASRPEWSREKKRLRARLEALVARVPPAS